MNLPHGVAALVAVGAMACDRASPAPDVVADRAPISTVRPQPDPTPSPVPAPSPKRSGLRAVRGDDIALSVVVRACKTLTCTDDGAEITILRDEAGRAGGLRHQGSPSRCSHPPATYVDHAGEPVHTVPMRPVSAQAAEAIAEKTRRAIAPFEEAESVRCEEVLAGRWVPPARADARRFLRGLGRAGAPEASYRFVGHVWKVHDCPPCPPSAACKPCEPYARLQSHVGVKTPDRYRVTPVATTGVAPAAGTKLKKGWYEMVLEPRGPWKAPFTFTLLSATRLPGEPRASPRK